MALRTYLECDHCSTRCEYDSFYVVVDSKMGPTGSTDDITESVDLCCCCCQMFLRDILKHYHHDQARTFVEWARKKPEAIRM